MDPVTVTVSSSIGPQKRATLESELRTQLNTLGIDELQIDNVQTDNAPESVTSAIEISGLLRLAHIPFDERRRRVESVTRIVLDTIESDSSQDVEIHVGWEQLRTTAILPLDLQTELDSLADEVVDTTEKNGDTISDVSVSSSDFYDEPPEAIREYCISFPMFDRLVRQRIQERRSPLETDDL